MFTKLLRCFLKSTLVITVAASPAVSQQNSAAVRGRISDEMNASIVGASVTITDTAGQTKSTVSNNEGTYAFNGLTPGKYVLRAAAKGFAPSGNEVDLKAGPGSSVDLTLKVTIEEQRVTVAGETPVSTDSTSNANQIVISGKELDALPDDPDELAAVLQALAGPTAGPNGGQIVVDGFSNAALPSKSAIREVRINQNPFAAENDQPAARIDVLTRPGTDVMKVSTYMNFNDESLNSRNPFTSHRQSFQVRQFGGSLSGTLIKNKASFFVDVERREINDNELVTATGLDSNLNTVTVSDAALTPRRYITINPRIDYAINNFHTLVARYTFSHSNLENNGVGGFSLPERAYNSRFRSHNIQVTETAIINPTVINETRFQFTNTRNESFGDSSTAAVLVSGAFFGGSSQVGHAVNSDNRWELSNFTAWQKGAHAFKFGGRLRGVHVDNTDPANFGGQFTFNGALVPLLDANNNIVTMLDPSTGTQVPVPVFASSIERYRRTLLFQQQSFTPAQTRALGGGAAQFSINTGNPVATVSQFDVSAYAQDEWRIRPNLTVSYGLRYEVQTNIHSPLNFAPRLAIAWSPGATAPGRAPTTVFRFGGGVFYNRFSETSTLRARRFNGFNEQQFIARETALFQCQTVPIINPASACRTSDGGAGQLVYSPPVATTPVDGFPNVPNIDSAGLTRLAVWRVAPDLRTPTVYAGGFQVERQLPYKTTMFAGVFLLQLQHVLRARDINATIPGSITPSDPDGVRPMGNIGHVYQMESSGRINQQQFFIGFNNRFNRNISFFTNYSLGYSKGDTDGMDTSFAPNPYDLSREYGRGGFDLRHRFSFVGNYIAPWWGLTFSPFILATSGAPFNIITGQDTNLDGVAAERPSFAPAGVACSGPSKPANIVCTPFGNFNVAPAAGEQFIPRNFGHSPSYFNVNLTVSKTFTFGPTNSAAAARPGAAPAPATAGGANREAKRYTMQVSVSFNNLFNRANLRPFEGNLSSPYFGESLGLNGFAGFGTPSGAGAGNRRIVGRVRLSF
ncbi:MAG TPA: carboxypeptidase-like regulatory domain-containing protein [Pyrinomonadaceae bacterium]|nr:carboxypeptidase-like regulatory domain-containing protein [Pyrinomonadaceae bacterium]